MSKYPRWFLPCWNIGAVLLLFLLIFSFPHMLARGQIIPGPAWVNAIAVDMPGLTFWFLIYELWPSFRPRWAKLLTSIFCFIIVLAVVYINLRVWR